MIALLTAIPALVLVSCLALFAIGLRALRADPVDGLDVDDLVLLRETQRRQARGLGPIHRLARPLVPSTLRLMGPRLQARLSRMIELAGRPDGIDVESVALDMAAWCLVTSPLTLLLAVRGQLWALPIIAIAVVTIPLARIARLRRLRQERIDRDLPDFLDVLAVTVTAGVSFRSALAIVGERFGGPLGEEVTLALHQIRNGASVREAFQRLRSRNDSETLASFITAYLQAEELGAPLAKTLNRIADDTRRETAQRQRRRAARVAPRVTLVTSLVLLPGAIVLLGVGFFFGLDFDLGSILGEAG